MDDKSNIGVPTPEIDYLVCGSCQQDFPLHDIVLFMQHKKFDCDDFRSVKQVQGLPSRLLLCKSCPRKFTTPWRLLQHAQRVHALLIYMEEEFSLMREESYAMRSTGNDIHSTVNACVQTDFPTVTKPVASLDEGADFCKESASQVYAHGLQADPGGTGETVEPSVIVTRNAQSFNHPQDFIPSVAQSLLVSSDMQNKMDIDIKHDSSVSTSAEDSTTDSRFKSKSLFLVPGEPQSMVSIKQYEVLTEAEQSLPADVLMTQNSGDTANAVPSETVETMRKTCEMEKHAASGATSKNEFLLEGAEIKEGIREEREVESKCCDNQACGITLMPGTHEKPKKCCAAVVPKKRKRHMQTKHVLGRRKSGERLKRSGDTNVIIDIDSSVDSPEKQNSSQSHQQTSQPCSSDFQILHSKNSNGIPISKEKSVIIQPGTTFSIPVPFTCTRPVVTSTSAAGGAVEQDRLNDGLTTSQAISSPSHTVQIREMETVQNQGLVPLGEAAEGLPSTLEIGGITYNLPRQKKRKYPTSKPFKCDQCDQAFNQRIHLRKHQSKHTGVKPFQCQQCDYSTVEKSHLKVHIRVHTGEKPFKCTYCEYATAQNSTLKIHLKRHHMRGASATPKCSDCGIECENQSELQSHVDQQHRTSPPCAETNN